MKQKKNVLFREEGSSLILVLLYLLVCVFLSGAVLSAAGANHARAEQTCRDRQSLLLNRSTMLTLSELLSGTQNLTIREVTWEDYHQVIAGLPENTPEPNCLQNLLYTCAAEQYARERNIGLQNMKFENFTPEHLSGEAAGTVEVVLKYRRAGELLEEKLCVAYSVAESGELTLMLPGMILRMGCNTAQGHPVTVTIENETARTVTTVYCWDEPLLEKGGNQ